MIILRTGSTSVSGEHAVQWLAVTVLFGEVCAHCAFFLRKVFIMTNVISRGRKCAFMTVCKLKSCVGMPLPMEEPQKAFDDQTIPDAEKFYLTYLPDRVQFEMTANPSTPNQNAFKEIREFI